MKLMNLSSIIINTLLDIGENVSVNRFETVKVEKQRNESGSVKMRGFLNTTHVRGAHNKKKTTDKVTVILITIINVFL